MGFFSDLLGFSKKPAVVKKPVAASTKKTASKTTAKKTPPKSTRKRT